MTKRITKKMCTPKFLQDKSPSEVADVIKVWREDETDDEPMGHSFDLLNSIETYMRGLNAEG